ncbi:MAG: hypothetical protein GX904_01285 [Acholeplasmataceae bacterium]|nr:hypothetical protein [Acholeplasmataceae bacterium]
MSKKTKFWLFLCYYLLNLFLVVLTIIFWTDNTFLKIVLSIYLLTLTGFFSYANRKKRDM